MPAPLGGWSLPWRDDFAQANVDSQPTEFGLPTGVNPLTYNPKAASQSLPYADPEGIPNDPEVGSAEWLDSVNQMVKSAQSEGNPNDG